MKIKKGLILTIAILTSINLVSCNNNTSSSNNSNSSQVTYTPNKLEQPGTISSINDIVNYLKKDTSSYSIQITQDGIIQMYKAFTPNYMYNEYTFDDKYSDGYIFADKGVCKFEFDENDDIKLSEVLSEEDSVITKLYDNNTVSSLYNWSLNGDLSGTSYTLSKKNEIMRFLKTCGISASSYLDLTDGVLKLELKADSNNSPYLLIDFTLEGTVTTTYSIKIFNLGTASISSLDDLVNSTPHAYIVNYDLKAIRELFKNDNYTRFVYDDNNNVMETEYFTSQYYYNDFSDEYLKQEPTLISYMKGYLYINEEEKLSLYGNTSLYYQDVYMFYVNNRTSFQLVTREDPNNPGYAQGGFTQKQDDVTEVMNYPKNLVLFDNYYKFTQKEDGSYSTTDSTIIADVISNFGVTASSGVTMAATDLVISFTKDDNASIKDITLTLNTQNYITGDALDPFVFNFSNFGTTSYQIVEDYITSNNLTRY